MILGFDKIKNYVKNLSERELSNPEGAGFDIRVGEIYKLETPGFLGVSERNTSKTKIVADQNSKDYILMPGEYVLIRTIEEFDVPSNVVMYTFPRSTLHRCGVMLIATQTSPGYKGKLVFGLKNLSNLPFRLEIGARIAHVQFHEVSGQTSTYRGQWQGGRVSTNGVEKQI